MKIKTPYYLIDEKALLRNLKIIERIRETSGAKSVLALKCFSTWKAFDVIKKYMDGTTSSSLYEARLGYEKFGKEVHGYCVSYSRDEVKEVVKFADKIIFNSVSQLEAFYGLAKSRDTGLRVNPGISFSRYDLADPARKYSRLGVSDKKLLKKALPYINGLMFHFNCENDNFDNFSSSMDYISDNYKKVLKNLKWVSLGGGLYFGKKGYPVSGFCRKLKEFSKCFGVQVYLEPGESAVTGSAQLVTSVLDIIHNRVDIAVVDASIEAHMPDLLIYRTNAKISSANRGKHKYMVTGCSCLAGDIFGTYRFTSPLKIGKIIKFSDAAGYTMVKKNWFNGLAMPSIAIKRLNGSVELIRGFTYKDFLNSLS